MQVNQENAVEVLEISDLEFNVGPSGSSEAVGGIPCVVLGVGIMVYKA
jgi:hypothetical protein